MKLVFATNNAHKLAEIRAIMATHSLPFEVLSLSDIGCTDDIPEDAPTLEGNALAKARWIHSRYGLDCFADDTGLEVDALGGEPGVHSARYAALADPHAASHDSTANMRLLLQRLDRAEKAQGGEAQGGETPISRSARFRTAIALILDGQEHLFEGRVEGEILRSPTGTDGFGYDPVFRPADSALSFAEMAPEAKNAISHRGRALEAMLAYLCSRPKE